MIILRNNVQDSKKTVFDSENYGYVTKLWPAGKYSVFFKPEWHTDDVKDYSVRTIFPVNVEIT